MEPQRNNTIVLNIRVKDIQKSIDFYTKALGLQITEKLIGEDGTIVHASVGFGSTLIRLLPIEYAQAPQMKEDIAKNKLGVGVEFYIGMNESKKLDEFLDDVKTKGITIINEPKTELWSNKLFTVTDPDGYTISFRQHINYVVHQRPWVNGEQSKRKTQRRHHDSIFSSGKLL